MEFKYVYGKDLDGNWMLIAECRNSHVARLTTEYWANANPGEAFAFGASADLIAKEYCLIRKHWI